MQPTDEQLYADLCRGCPRAFDAFYARFERRLFGFILGFVKSREDAEDVFHDVFQAVIQASRRGGEPPAAVASWLFTIARNRCLNYRRGLRAVASEAVETLPASDVGASERLVEQDREAALARSVARLPRPLGDVYRLRVDGQSYDEMSRELGVPVGTVKSRVHNLIKRLQKELGPWVVK